MSETTKSVIGPLPTGWDVRQLGDVLEKQVRAVSVNPSDTYREIGIRSHGRGIFHKEPTKGTELGDKRVFWVENNCLTFNIVFAWEGAVALTRAADQGMIASHRFPMFSARDKQQVDVEYLRRFFQTPVGVRLLGEASPGGAGRNRTLNQKLLAGVPVPVPPLGEQRKISAILASVDDAIGSTEAVIDQLQVVKKATMAELIRQGLLGRHARFKQTKIGEVPEDWDVRSLREVATIFNGKAAGTGGTWLRVFKTKHVYDGNVRLLKPELARDDVAARVPVTTFLRPDDVLTPNMAHGTIGRVAFVPSVDEKWTVDGQVMVIRADAVHLSGRFLFEWLSLPQGRQQLLDLEKGGAFDTLRGQTHIYPKDVRELAVPVPSVEEQMAIGRCAASFDVPLDANRDALNVLLEIKKGLMQVLLTGELRVTPDEVAA